MPRSMTGFGRSESHESGWTQSWEIRSVNHRHLDTKWRLPVNVRALETDLDRILRSNADRGRVEVYLCLSIHQQDLVSLKLNKPAALAMLRQVEDLARDHGREFAPDYSRIITTSHLWEEAGGAPDPSLAESLKDGLRQAIESWNRSRELEGAALMDDLSARLIRLDGWLRALKERTPRVKNEKAEALESRIRTFIEEHSIELDESRLIQEIAFLSDRLDVSEELVRLTAHLRQFGDILEKNGVVGKRLDFLLQECFREINTCGNKAQDSEVSRLVVDFKAELEKCREQVQNIE